MRSENVLPYNIKYIKENWEIGFHGTKYHVLESIMKNGLLPSGAKINGTEIKPPSDHIPLNTEIDGIQNRRFLLIQVFFIQA